MTQERLEVGHEENLGFLMLRKEQRICYLQKRYPFLAAQEYHHNANSQSSANSPHQYHPSQKPPCRTQTSSQNTPAPPWHSHRPPESSSYHPQNTAVSCGAWPSFQMCRSCGRDPLRRLVQVWWMFLRFLLYQRLFGWRGAFGSSGWSVGRALVAREMLLMRRLCPRIRRKG